VLIAACAELQSTGLDFELCLAGDGPLRPSIEQSVRQSGLSERVRFLGSVRHELLPDWYRAADATVLSSRSEGLPNVLRESLACGTPFASTDVGSIAEIADPAWSRLAPANDAGALAQAIAGVLTPECRAAAATYRARTWSACAADVVHLFDHRRDARTLPGTEFQPDRNSIGSQNQRTFAPPPRPSPRNGGREAAICDSSRSS
jgi:glycosyltransferase involved in cell wall biosynthesis